MINEGRFHRQILLFGREGQEKIEATSVAVVGASGTGSHVVQQLAYLGVCKFAIIDPDRVSRSNLNRLIGATEKDVVEARLKVEVARDAVQRVRPEAEITILPQSFVTNEGFKLIKRADFVFGCVDRDGARLILTELCSAYEKPYLDMATDTGLDEVGVSSGGRVLFSFAGRMCLVCKDELTQAEIRRDLSTPAQREAEDRLYGVPRNALGDEGPSVVSLNGILASAAVTEFMAFVTGLREPKEHLRYDGRAGILKVNKDQPLADCYFCKSARGKGAGADVERYIKEGVGRYL